MGSAPPWGQAPFPCRPWRALNRANEKEPVPVTEDPPRAPPPCGQAPFPCRPWRAINRANEKNPVPETDEGDWLLFLEKMQHIPLVVVKKVPVPEHDQQWGQHRCWGQAPFPHRPRSALKRANEKEPVPVTDEGDWLLFLQKMQRIPLVVVKKVPVPEHDQQ